ncbi:GNAT family N-acetyltransferase [Companilactobacillus hulinensis]|uniref:GNAT family N-acetyltransferase n=1 Tax=Companilactobacillus hulinensis TaxID=2486007 RepID=UPI000F7A52B7|nr:GNAT family N-acetyltransferase [Companilactobacillus hulinensis]
MIDYKENTEIKRTDLEQLYLSVGWFAYTLDMDILENAVNNSLSVITAWQDDKLVGLIRAVGDGVTILYVQDILINPEFQNKGIGTILMTKIIDKYNNVRQKVLLTEEAPDVRHFYEKFNFVSCDQGNAVAFYREF